jgi:hypothetical protein
MCGAKTYYTSQRPCVYCGQILTLQVRYVHLRAWVEKVLDGLTLLLVPLIPIVLYFLLIKSYFNGGDLKKEIDKFLDGS